MGDRAGRWFHTLVVVGTAMTACGGSTTVETPSGPDGGRTGAQPVASGKDAGSKDAGSTDGAFASRPDAAAIATPDAAPDGATMYAMCCVDPFHCRLDDAGAPVCAVSCPFYCCDPFNGCIQ